MRRQRRLHGRRPRRRRPRTPVGEEQQRPHRPGQVKGGQLKNLLARLSQQKIECLLLKGLALAVPIYGDIAARPARDMDLLLQKHDLQRALPLFEALGYRRYDTPEHDLTDLEFENEIILFRQYDGMNVDLHWSPIDSPYYQRRLDPQ